MQNFVEGDLHDLLKFIERFERAPTIDRYVLINSGDGRVLSAAPSVSKELTGGHMLTCPIYPSAERITAAELPMDFALSEDHDLMPTENGGIAEVAGIAALPQTIKTCLSSQKGESPFHRDFGTRFAKIFSPARRLSMARTDPKIGGHPSGRNPLCDPLDSRQYTPLQCVEQVYGVELLANVPSENWLPIRLDFEVKGLGRWQRDLSICVPTEEVKRPSWQELMAGPLDRIQS
ncbi:hypothetical protein [Bradyrhizobium sp. SBR1B]|uniref:hypothetical protein n=1 Tax=Bradyrhizobium sp. SBR1B TaxID=2663836 RepID=UPI001605864F|nr:hypothetical protein [Bradyrhizobium sp. SBR1B]MBB4382696.1 hypothetical protein [Bradyrhizobium sp. SBR1B]